MSSYFSNRKQSIVVYGLQMHSNIFHGVSQGSVPVPILFINDFSNYLQPVKSVLFADDTTILSQSQNLIEHNRN